MKQRSTSRTVGQIADLFRVTEKTVRDWIRQGLPTQRQGGKGPGNGATVDLEDAVRWHLDYIQLDAEKIRVAREQADKLALENAVTRGDLVPLEVWAGELEKFLAEIRAQLLAMPNRLAPQLVGKGQAAIGERIKDDVYDVLTRLSEYGKK